MDISVFVNLEHRDLIVKLMSMNATAIRAEMVLGVSMELTGK